MSRLISMFADFLDEKEIGYDIIGKANEIILIKQRIKGTSSVARFLILTDEDDEDNEYIQVKIYDLCTMPNSSESILKTINSLNNRYRWYTIYMDDDNDIVLSMDAAMDGKDPCGRMLEFIIRGMSICEKIYPELMKAAWT